MGLVIFLGVPLLLAALVTYWLGRSARRVAIIVAVGVALLLAWFLLIWATAPRSVEEADCHHCAEYFGRWIDPIGVWFSGILVALWVAGVVVGWAVRAVATRTRT